MGFGMATSLRRAGFEVTAYDLDAGAVALAVDAGARAASSSVDCARVADAVITMLPAPPHVEQVLLRDGVIVREGTPAELTGGVNVATEIRYRRDGAEIVERTDDPTRRLNELTGEALARGETLDQLEVRRPSLEDVYLELTGD